MRKRKTQFVPLFALLALFCAQAALAAPVTVTGVVRNSAGVPQIGAEVQLLRADLSLAATAVTDGHGRFLIASVLPGRYAVKAIASSYLPTLRENVHVRTGTVVNLTLSTLYEAIQWLPAHPRGADAQKDDWRWTLRSAANRPLLRWLEDGPLVVVEDGKGSGRKLRARLIATGQSGTFGEYGERISTTLESTPSGSQELLARVDFAPGSDAGLESMLGFRQDLGYAGSVQSVAAVAVQPGIEGPSGQGLEEWAMTGSETIHFGDALTLDAGSTQVVAHLRGSGTLTAMLPFAEMRWQNRSTALSYKMASFAPALQQENGSAAQAWLPVLATRGSRLTMMRGLHHELGWERRNEAAGVSVSVFSDRVENPVVNAALHLNSGEIDAAQMQALVDRNGLLRAAGPNFQAAGVQASFEGNLPAGNRVRLSYANGSALVIPALTHPGNMAEVLAAAKPRRAQTYAIMLSGTLEGTGTRWSASYRWQPDDTVTAVAPYAVNAAAPYLNLHFRQPVRLGSSGAANLEFLFDVQNLLAEGYRPFLMQDGSVMLFAQARRGLRGGLAFTF